MAELKRKLRKKDNKLMTSDELGRLPPLERVQRRFQEFTDYTGLGGQAHAAEPEPQEEQKPYVPVPDKPPQEETQTEKQAEEGKTGKEDEGKQLDKLDKLFQEYRTETQTALGQLAEGDKKFLKAQQQKLQERLEAADKLKDEQVERQQMLELAQVLGQAFAKLGAAATGLRTGRDVARGVDFQPTDWNRQYDRLLRRYDQRLQEIRRRTDEEAKPERREREAARERAEADIRARWLMLQEQLREARQQAREAARQAPDQGKLQQNLEKQRAKVKDKYAKVRSELFKYDEGDQEEARTIANINKLLEGAVTPDQLKELSEERGGRNVWNLWLEDEPDKFKEWIDRMEQQELQVYTPEMVTMIAPNGQVGQIPANKVREAEEAGFRRQ